MRVRTAVALLAVVALLGGVVVVGVGFVPGDGSLAMVWLSDTPRENARNHHAVGVGPDAETVVAPVTEVPGDDVTVTDRSCSLVRLAPENGSVLWRATTPAGACFSHALTEPAIADLDGDGGLEAAVASTEDALVVYDARTGAEEWRVPLSTYGYGRPAVANVTAGQGTDVVASDIEGTVVLASGNGTVVWRVDLSRRVERSLSVTAAPVVEDVTGDGAPEVVVGTSRGLVVLGRDGDVRWSRDVPSTYPATAGVSTDGALVVTSYYESVQAFDGASGRLEWQRSVTSSRLGDVVDGDGDGRPEAYLGRVGGEVLAVDARTGETEWSTTVSVGESVIVPPPASADVDGDGRPEVVAATETGRVAVLDAGSGEELAAYERDVPVWTFVTPADVDGDGSAEILVRYGDGRVVALDHADRGPFEVL